MVLRARFALLTIVTVLPAEVQLVAVSKLKGQSVSQVVERHDPQPGLSSGSNLRATGNALTEDSVPLSHAIQKVVSAAKQDTPESAVMPASQILPHPSAEPTSADAAQVGVFGHNSGMLPPKPGEGQTLVCPPVTMGTAGICMEECFSNYECAAANMLCCSNGCGHTCQIPALAEKPAAVEKNVTHGGTACECMCGERTIWKREVFPGNVVEEKEHECEHEVCPKANIPGLIVHKECTFVEDLSDLTAGTVCDCLCGDKIVWQSRSFHGDVVKEKEDECLKQVCPEANPIPGYKFEAQCHYDRDLFSLQNGYLAPHPQSWQTPPPAKGGAFSTSVWSVVLASASIAAANIIF